METPQRLWRARGVDLNFVVGIPGSNNSDRISMKVKAENVKEWLKLLDAKRLTSLVFDGSWDTTGCSTLLNWIALKFRNLTKLHISGLYSQHVLSGVQSTEMRALAGIIKNPKIESGFGSPKVPSSPKSSTTKSFGSLSLSKPTSPSSQQSQSSSSQIPKWFFLPPLPLVYLSLDGYGMGSFTSDSLRLLIASARNTLRGLSIAGILPGKVLDLCDVAQIVPKLELLCFTFVKLGGGLEGTGTSVEEDDDDKEIISLEKRMYMKMGVSVSSYQVTKEVTIVSPMLTPEGWAPSLRGDLSEFRNLKSLTIQSYPRQRLISSNSPNRRSTLSNAVIPNSLVIAMLYSLPDGLQEHETTSNGGANSTLGKTVNVPSPSLTRLYISTPRSRPRYFHQYMQIMSPRFRNLEILEWSAMLIYDTIIGVDEGDELALSREERMCLYGIGKMLRRLESLKLFRCRDARWILDDDDILEMIRSPVFIAGGLQEFGNLERRFKVQLLDF
ncbi:hypothetical protein HDU76_006273 [Blyttiomyces sp. JEL0837]|nr:hypothetical protein HDU76_006273 [Blyttiomyces sp. JEL0837]